MEQIKYGIEDDTLYVYTPYNKLEGCYEKRPIINKDVFIECYKRWIIPEIENWITPEIEKEIENDLV